MRESNFLVNAHAVSLVHREDVMLFLRKGKRVTDEGYI